MKNEIPTQMTKEIPTHQILDKRSTLTSFLFLWLECGQAIKKCYDDAWEKYGLGDPKYDVVDGDLK